jgi:UDP-apiose/xylose synthase
MAILAGRCNARGRIFNVGNPANEVSIAELAGMMIREYEKLRPDSTGSHSAVSVSGTEFYGEGYEDSDRRVPDISLISSLLTWRPRTDLATAIRRTMAAYLETYELRMSVRAAC